MTVKIRRTHLAALAVLLISIMGAALFLAPAGTATATARAKPVAGTCHGNGVKACPTTSTTTSTPSTSTSSSTTTTTSPTSTTSTTTSPTSTTSTTTAPPTGSWSCTHLGDGGCPETFAQTNCPAPDLGQSGYCYPGNSNSNGWNTYIENDCWGSASCGTDPSTYKLEANNPGDWQTTVLQGPAGDTAVKSYPDVQQLYDNVPITSFTQLTSTYAETMPAESTGTLAQFAWDIWIDGPAGTVNEVMVWVDNKNRGSGGADQVGTATIAGQDWTIYKYGTGELIFSLGAPGTFAQQSSGTVDLLAVLNTAVAQGFISADRKVGQVNAGWEICSTGGAAQTFRVTDYTLTSS